MNVFRLKDLPPAAVAREIGSAGVRICLILGVVSLTFFYTQPAIGAPEAVLPHTIIFLVNFLLVFGAYVSSIAHARVPDVRALEAVIVIIPYYLLLFSSLYLQLSQQDPANFSEPLTPVWALYFTVGVFSTSGSGINPMQDGSALLVTGQMLFNLLVLGVLIRLLISAARRVRSKHPPGTSVATVTVRNRYAWLIVLLPAVWSVGFFASFNAHWAVVVPLTILLLAANIWLVRCDRRVVKAAGMTAPSAAWGYLLPPGYLFWRGQLLRESLVKTLVWCYLLLAAVAAVFVVHPIRLPQQEVVDANRVAREIMHELHRDGFPTAVVTCPTGVPVIPGHSFDCTGSLGDRQFSVTVQILTGDRIDWDVRELPKPSGG